MARHQNRRAFWRAHYQHCREQGMTLKDYAAQEGLTLSVFYGWSKRFRKENLDSNTPSPVGFSRVRVACTSSVQYRLQFPNGLVLEWQGEADSNHLKQLVQALA